MLEKAVQDALARTRTERLRLTKIHYGSGGGDYLRYLDARCNDLANQMGLIENRTQRQLTLAGLFVCLAETRLGLSRSWQIGRSAASLRTGYAV